MSQMLRIRNTQNIFEAQSNIFEGRRRDLSRLVQVRRQVDATSIGRVKQYFGFRPYTRYSTIHKKNSAKLRRYILPNATENDVRDLMIKLSKSPPSTWKAIRDQVNTVIRAAEADRAKQAQEAASALRAERAQERKNRVEASRKSREKQIKLDEARRKRRNELRRQNYARRQSDLRHAGWTTQEQRLFNRELSSVRYSIDSHEDFYRILDRYQAYIMGENSNLLLLVIEGSNDTFYTLSQSFFETLQSKKRDIFEMDILEDVIEGVAGYGSDAEVLTGVIANEFRIQLLDDRTGRDYSFQVSSAIMEEPPL